MNPVKVKCSILVLSCDAYSDLWTPFFTLLASEWPDCPFPIFLGSGQGIECPQNVISLKSSAGRDWSQCLLDYLKMISSEYVLLMLDDFFLRAKVDTNKIQYCLAFAISTGAQQVRLVPRPPPQIRIEGERLIGSCSPGTRYRVCTQAAIWKKSALANLVRAGETAWQFERNATTRAELQAVGHFSVIKSVLPYEGFWAHHVIEKGRWLPHEKWIFSCKKIGCNFQRRPTLGWKRTFICQAARQCHRVLSLLPYGRAESARIFMKRILIRTNSQWIEQLGGGNSDL